MDDQLTVNGKRCVVRVLDGAALANFEHLERLVQMQNRAFALGSRQPVLPADTPRYDSVAEYVGQTGAASTTFIIMAAGDASEIFGSVTIAPYAPPPADLKLPPVPAAFARVPLAYDGGEEARWEVRCLAVSPSAQKQGLAGRLLALAEAHALAQSAARTATVRLMLSCIRENNGAFYARRGFVVAEGEERRMPPGFIGSEGGFSIVFMDKYVQVRASG